MDDSWHPLLFQSSDLRITFITDEVRDHQVHFSHSAVPKLLGAPNSNSIRAHRRMVLLMLTNRLALGFVAAHVRRRNLSHPEAGSRMLLLDRALLLMRVVRGRLSRCARDGSRRRLIHRLPLHRAWCSHGCWVGAGILRLRSDAVQWLGLLGLDRDTCWEILLRAELGRDWSVVKTG